MRHRYLRMGYGAMDAVGILNSGFRVSKLELYRARIIPSWLRVVNILSVQCMLYNISIHRHFPSQLEAIMATEVAER